MFESSAELSNLGPQVQIFCRSFQLWAPSSNLLQIFPTWGPKFKSSADLSNLGPQVQIFCRSFQLGAPSSNLPQIFPTWGPIFESSADSSKAPKALLRYPQ